ncbi:hypothetical protein D6764_02185, partial [Candidatus Woesearchaeota archaeon]
MPRKRRSKPVLAHKKKHKETPRQKQEGEQSGSDMEMRGNFFYNLYDKHYKTLLLIPMLMLILAILSIGIKVAATGDFINRGVS